MIKLPMLWIAAIVVGLVAYFSSSKEKYEQNKNILYFLYIVFAILVVIYFQIGDFGSDNDQDYYRYTEEEEECYRKYQKNYPDVPADFGENALSFQMCLEEARS